MHTRVIVNYGANITKISLKTKINLKSFLCVPRSV